MVLPASEIVRSNSTTNNCTKRADEIYDEVEDLYLTMENFQQSEILAIENPKRLVKKESLQMEKQISVDPISLTERESSMKGSSPVLVLPPAFTAPKVIGNGMYPPLSLVSSKPKFISCSLPNSATSSPRFGSSMPKKWRIQSQASLCQLNSLGRHHSAVHSIISSQHLQRSKSCGEGRASAPSDEFDLCIRKLNAIERNYRHNDSFSKSEAMKDGEKGVNVNMAKHPSEEEFKCGALCLFLPGFGKGKAVRARKEDGEMPNVISRTVSLEKFECGSWSSSAIMNENEEDGESINLYFDLPSELIRSSMNDANSPVTTAFVFDKDRKGVLKPRNGGGTRATARKSHESARHVRFSTSSPTSYPASPTSCITPRLRRAREEFNAFLDAQTA